MVLADDLVFLVEYNGSLVKTIFPSVQLRLFLIGIAMGLSAALQIARNKGGPNDEATLCKCFVAKGNSI